MVSVAQAVARAEAILPGCAAPDGQSDPRWQAIIAVAERMGEDIDAVWSFAARWGISDDPDLRAAIATCVVEHLLDENFERIFPLVARLAKEDRNFAKTVKLCWTPDGNAKPQHLAAFNALLEELRHAA